MWSCGLDSTGSAQGLVACCVIYGNKPVCSVNDKEFLD